MEVRCSCSLDLAALNREKGNKTMPKKAAKKKKAPKKEKVKKTNEEINILLADQVYLDSRSRKYLVAGLFQFIHTTKLPTQYPRFTIFVEVVGAVAERECELTIVSPAGKKLYEFKGRLRNYLTQDVFGLVLKELGVYRISLSLAGKLVAGRSFTVVQIAQKAPVKGH